MPLPFDLIYTDYHGLRRRSSTWDSPSRIIDTFGTEPACNHEEYATLPGYCTNWGYWNLNPKQYMSMFRECPASNLWLFESSGRESQISTLEKEKVLGILNKYMEIHSTMYYKSQRSPKVPAFMKNHGLLSQPEFQQLQRKAKVRNSTHCPNSLNHEFFPGKPTSREVEPYLPYEYTCGGSWSGSTPTSSTRTSVQLRAQLPPGTRASQSPFVLALNATHLQWAQNTSKVPEAWPPPHSLQAWLATTERSCMDACLDHGLLCKPSFFPFLNSQETFLQLQVPCDSTEWEMHHLYPALAQPSQECYLQKDPLLCSCTGSNTEYQALPCRDFLKGEVALCQGCLSLNHEFFPGKPTSREVEPYLPYEYTCGGSWSGSTPTSSTRTSVQLRAQLPPGTRASQSPFVLALNATHLQWAQNTSKVPEAWPPPHSLQAWLATTERSCMDACLDHGLLCKPSFFPFLNSQETFLQLQVPCDSTEWEMHHLYPALAQPSQECYLQKDPLLCSCTGSNTEYQALPCRDFLKGEVALCQGCL
ncbi:Alpha-1,6-mannosylglycoprotein 6-beta-N-acetylglucosaminyltransferase B [Sciurus carolinensis]|uniref:alpha-1,6-mannosyl-glycoprotein 6-beta-N-acetylglucosaminyltransferase n=1 Tax=Sciurus carolinensis TaxID=30640 RepID=A0AA41MXF5_SCICA|nr:Alpha-1,6-mannosylglycoprotein 6-beta-N-acetylglucosaminyltransferase B [Sciurus carolinensis]